MIKKLVIEIGDEEIELTEEVSEKIRKMLDKPIRSVIADQALEVFEKEFNKPSLSNEQN